MLEEAREDHKENDAENMRRKCEQKPINDIQQDYVADFHKKDCKIFVQVAKLGRRWGLERKHLCSGPLMLYVALVTTCMQTHTQMRFSNLRIKQIICGWDTLSTFYINMWNQLRQRSKSLDVGYSSYSVLVGNLNNRHVRGPPVQLESASVYRD